MKEWHEPTSSLCQLCINVLSHPDLFKVYHHLLQHTSKDHHFPSIGVPPTSSITLASEAFLPLRCFAERGLLEGKITYHLLAPPTHTSSKRILYSGLSCNQVLLLSRPTIPLYLRSNNDVCLSLIYKMNVTWRMDCICIGNMIKVSHHERVIKID